MTHDPTAAQVRVIVSRRLALAATRRALDPWRIRRDPSAFARALGVHVGSNCRLLGISRATFGSEPYLVSLGNRVTVTAEVRFITHDGGVWIFRQEWPEAELVAGIAIGDDVFIGARALILPGVRVGSNTVIGAGSVVTREVPSGQVVAGVPARAICTTADYKQRVTERLTFLRSSPVEKKREIYEAQYQQWLNSLR